jgi:hypothetical protein
MTKRRKSLLLLAGVVLAGGAYLLFIRDREPTCKGQPLSWWVLLLNGGRDREAAEAIQQIGWRAEPYLIAWMQYDPPGWQERFFKSCDMNNKLRWLVRAHSKKHSEKVWRAFNASQAFALLGPERPRAIPVLVRILNRPKPGLAAHRAAHALGCLGPDGIPPLLAGLTNRNAEIRVACAWGIPISARTPLPRPFFRP